MAAIFRCYFIDTYFLLFIFMLSFLLLLPGSLSSRFLSINNNNTTTATNTNQISSSGSSSSNKGIQFVRNIYRLLHDDEETDALPIYESWQILPEYCDGYTHTDSSESNKQSLARYIFRGHPLSQRILTAVTGLSKVSMAGQQMADKLEEFLLNSDGLVYNRTAASILMNGFLKAPIVLYGFLGVFLLLWALCMFFSCLSNSCFSNEQLHHVPKMREASASRRRCLICSALFFLAVLVLAAAVAVTAALRLSFSSRDLRCQTARVSAEVFEGILYDQSKEYQSPWLSHLPSELTYSGIADIEKHYQNLKIKYAAGKLGDFSRYKKAVEELIEVTAWSYRTSSRAADEIYRVRESESDSLVTFPSFDLILQPESGVSALLEKLSKSVNDTVKSMTEHGISQQKLKAYRELTSILDFISHMKRFAKRINRLFRVNPVNSVVFYGWGYGFVLFLIFPIFTLPSVAFIAVMLYKLFKHSRNITKPDLLKYRYWFGRCCCSFAFMSLFFVVSSVLLLLGLSFSEPVCEFVRSIASDPAAFRKTSSDGSVMAKATDICARNSGFGNLTMEIPAPFEFYGDLNLIVSDQISAVISLLRTVGELGSSVVANPNQIDKMPSLLFVPPEILFSGTQTNKIKLSSDRGADFDFFQKIANKANNNQATNFANRGFMHFKPFELHSFQDHLNQIEMHGQNLGCKNTVFCAVASESKVCSNYGGAGTSSTGNSREFHINTIVFNNAAAPEWKTSPTAAVDRYDDNLSNQFARRLLNLSCDVRFRLYNSGAEVDERTKLFSRHAFVAGLYLAKQKVDAGQVNKRYAKMVDVGVERFGGILKPLSDLKNSTTKYLFAVKNTEEVDGSKINCKPLVHSIGAVVDGFCEGVQHDLLWIALSYLVVGVVSAFFWFICYAFYRYYTKSIFAVGKAVRERRMRRQFRLPQRKI